MSEHWSVTVAKDDDEILTIAEGWLAGKELSREEEETVRKAAEHLLSFLGVAYTIYEPAEAGNPDLPF